MRLVNDDRVAALGDLFPPFGLLLLLCLGWVLGRFSARDREQASHDKRELLQGGDHDPGPVNQRCGELTRVLVNRLDDSLRVLDLVDGVLELTVEHAAIGDHDHAVEDLLVVLRMQTREPVREPGDAVRLAAAGRVLDQVVVARTFDLRRIDQLVDRIELVETRENHRLVFHRAGTVRVLDLLLACLGEDVRADDIEEALAFQHLSPEVVRPITGMVGRITGAALDPAWVTASIERQEAGPLALQPRGHVDFFCVGGEMDEGALLESEQPCVGIPILSVLADRALPGLAGHRVLELAGRNRDAVEREQQVDLVALAGMAARLPHHRELVARESPQRVLVEPMRRLEVGEPERRPVEPEPVAQHVQRTLVVQLLCQRFDDSRLQLILVKSAHLVPLLALSVAHE